MILLQKSETGFSGLSAKSKKHWNLAFFRYASDKAYIKKKYADKF